MKHYYLMVNPVTNVTIVTTEKYRKKWAEQGFIGSQKKPNVLRKVG